MHSSIPCALLLLAAAGQAAGLALWGQQQPQNNGIASVEKRQGTGLTTRLSTVYRTGDPSRPRTAAAGFVALVDVEKDLWGYCTDRAGEASDCRMVGVCVDNYSCSDGCGATDKPYPTGTCTGVESYCSTAYLTLANNVGPFTYLGCARAPTTATYFAFTTDATQSTSSTASSTSSTGPQETTGTNPGSSTQQEAPQTTTGPSNTADSTPSDTTDAQSTPSSSSSTSTSTSRINIGAIVGGVVGCVALLCGCAIVIFWLRHRNRNRDTAAVAAAAVTEAHTEPPSPETASSVPPYYDYKGAAATEMYQQPTCTELPNSMAAVEMPGSAPQWR